ncbi:MAG: ribonuclease HII [Candidatus Nealsonbacteria bacterium CG10_big_fil_rev_8_21_14_0_10_36_24]|uniref:Ribonuclease HII n=2 Tax=Candidatus Nealsoniibacteriota TaxID=1817911 RepID=A0A2H0YMX5_9BACT|nr:MAG: ribonuclease HII [Candidatus Nealsonbacteria bacterium CG10_big_fil_rev_8_21_14_0_10_36_24]PIS39838.1 MAG: ribonuclease HII [Candidatus Nealsonbacteria bacterium CG08_land_8_20_14_0_20_36_22]
MRYPNLREEKKLWKKGYGVVVGLDEAGRGPLAGPVVAAAVMIKIQNSKFKIQNCGVNDSKKLTPKKREKLYKLLENCPFIGWGIGRVSEKVIDKINILEATKLAMIKAVRNLKVKSQKSKIKFLIIDGNFRINLDIPQKSIIKADEKVFSVAAASILAKVTRDRIMTKYHKKYPQYGFTQHKGYPTNLHRKLLKKYGFCKIHRKSFRVS